MLAFLESVGGLGFAILGAALTAGLCCIGSAKGTGMVGEAAAGLTSEDPDKSTKCLILQVLPGTQGLYGFVALFLVLGQTGLLSGSVLDLSLTQGLSFFAACLPIMLGGWLSAIFQGRVPPRPSTSWPSTQRPLPRASSTAASWSSTPSCLWWRLL